MTKRRKKITDEQKEKRRRQFFEIYKNLSDAQISEIHNVSVRTVQRWKRGDYDPGIHFKLASGDKLSSMRQNVVSRQRARQVLERILSTADHKMIGLVAGILDLLDKMMELKQAV